MFHAASSSTMKMEVAGASETFVPAISHERVNFAVVNLRVQ
jgi:hypothetical protein